MSSNKHNAKKSQNQPMKKQDQNGETTLVVETTLDALKLLSHVVLADSLARDAGKLITALVGKLEGGELDSAIGRCWRMFILELPLQYPDYESGDIVQRESLLKRIFHDAFIEGVALGDNRSRA